MRKSVWNKRIPTLAGLVLIIIGVGVTSFLARNGIIFFGNAAPSKTPENIRITNITDSSATISYTTADTTAGIVSFGKVNTKEQTVNDDRDQQQEKINFYKVHHVTLRNLDPQTKYIVSIDPENPTNTLEITTGAKITTLPTTQQPLVGKVVLPNGSSPTEALVYITAVGLETLSTLIKSDGTFIIPLNSLRTQDLSAYTNLKAETVMQLLISNGSLQSNIKLLANQTNPVPIITLSNNYDFTISNTPVASSAAVLRFPERLLDGTESTGLSLTTPTKDEKFSDTQPVFKGTALPNADVEIVIHSDEAINKTIKADSSGHWTFRPTAPLSSGAHTITITTKDANGVIKKITQSFTILGAGQQIDGFTTPTPTPRVTVSPTPTITTAPSLTPTKTPTPTQSGPTPTLSATPSSTITPTIAASPTPTLVPSATPTIIQPSPTPIYVTATPMPTLLAAQPTSATKTPELHPGSESTIFLGITAVVTTMLGIALFIFTRGATTL